MLRDPEQKISRPRQLYDGPDLREYVPIEARGQGQAA
jgi:citrate synthase